MHARLGVLSGYLRTCKRRARLLLLLLLLLCGLRQRPWLRQTDKRERGQDALALAGACEGRELRLRRKLLQREPSSKSVGQSVGQSVNQSISRLVS